MKKPPQNEAADIKMSINYLQTIAGINWIKFVTLD